MILHVETAPGRFPGRPCLVWLHGLLGCGAEWREVADAFHDWPQMWVDLPGHGGSAQAVTTGFDDVSARLSATLLAHGITRYWLVGYSLGGRIAMYHACYGDARGLEGLIVEGGHPGLEDAAAREIRLQHDSGWAERFRREPLRKTLQAWYRQPVFSDLNSQQRQALIALRTHNCARGVAAMLQATSLAHQPDLTGALRRLQIPFFYFCGERDVKFQALARARGLPLRDIPAAGHNAHRENPAAFRAALHELLLANDEDPA